VLDGYRICGRGTEFCSVEHEDLTPLDRALAVLRYVGFYGLGERVWWRTDPKYAPVTFFVNCNDVFCWGTSDCEDLTPERLPLLGKALDDCAAALGGDADAEKKGWPWGIDLFVARLRGERPQGAAYPTDQRLWPLFDACGPERKTGLGNPYAPGEYGQKEG
jgi:hypothetical protein